MEVNARIHVHNYCTSKNSAHKINYAQDLPNFWRQIFDIPATHVFYSHNIIWVMTFCQKLETIFHRLVKGVK